MDGLRSIGGSTQGYSMRKFKKKINPEESEGIS